MNFDEFDIWWRERGKDTPLQQMRAFLEKALLQKPPREIEYSILWRLSRYHHFAAMKNAEDIAVSRGHFVAGAQRAQLAQTLRKVVQHQAREADFWWSVNALESARLNSEIAAFWVLPRVTKTLEALVLGADKDFHFAGAHRVLGRITHLKPKILGGGASKSLSWFEDALEIAPDNSTTLLYFAQALRDANRREEAQKVLRAIVSQDVDDDWKWEQARDKAIAARLLKLNEPEASATGSA